MRAILLGLILAVAVIGSASSQEAVCLWQHVHIGDIDLAPGQIATWTVFLDPGDTMEVAAGTDGPPVYISIRDQSGVTQAGPVPSRITPLDYQAYQSGAFTVFIENRSAQSVGVYYTVTWVRICGFVPTATSVPSSVESVPLIPGCNPVASTYPDNTPIGDIVNAVSSPSVSIWKFGQDAWWYGYSSDYPGIGDLTELDRLDVVFICVGHSATFTRPLI